MVKGVVHATSKYLKVTNKGTVNYDKEYKDEHQEAKEIRATSPEAAKQQFQAEASSDFSREANDGKSTAVDKVEETGVTLSSSYVAKSEADVQMKAVKFPQVSLHPL